MMKKGFIWTIIGIAISCIGQYLSMKSDVDEFNKEFKFNHEENIRDIVRDELSKAKK